MREANTYRAARRNFARLLRRARPRVERKNLTVGDFFRKVKGYGLGFRG